MAEPMHELIVGGQKSGKSARAETLAARWLAQAPGHEAVLLATCQPWDDEMRARIARHQRDRALRVPGIRTVHVPYALGPALLAESARHTLVVIDCLTLWLTQLRFPMDTPIQPETGVNAATALLNTAQVAMFLEAIEQAPGPVLMVSNEVGLGVIPMGAAVRAFVDELGGLNQQVARRCQRVTLMAAGLPLYLKGGSE